MKIGEIIPKDRDIILNEGRPSLEISVTNTGDRPIQAGSHYHFFEVNRHMDFVSTSLPVLPSDLNRGRQRWFPSLPWAVPGAFSVSMTLPARRLQRLVKERPWTTPRKRDS